MTPPAEAETATPTLEATNRLSCIPYLRFCADTGKLFWMKRDPASFKEGLITAEHACNTWNEKSEGKVAFNTPSGHGYLEGVFNGKKHYAHRIIWEFFNGPIKKGLEIDHINGVRDDNRIENLRLVSKSQNCRNSAMQSNNTSGITGVSKYRNGWIARASSPKGICRIGFFLSKEKARSAIRDFYSDPLNGYSCRHGLAI